MRKGSPVSRGGCLCVFKFRSAAQYIPVILGAVTVLRQEPCFCDHGLEETWVAFVRFAVGRTPGVGVPMGRFDMILSSTFELLCVDVK